MVDPGGVDPDPDHVPTFKITRIELTLRLYDFVIIYIQCVHFDTQMVISTCKGGYYRTVLHFYVIHRYSFCKEKYLHN